MSWTKPAPPGRCASQGCRPTRASEGQTNRQGHTNSLQLRALGSVATCPIVATGEIAKIVCGPALRIKTYAADPLGHEARVLHRVGRGEFRRPGNKYSPGLRLPMRR